MSNPIITSKFKTSNRIFYLFGILFCSVLSFLSFSKYNPNNFITYPNLVPGSIFILFSFYILYSILILPKINIYSDKIELHRFLGINTRTVLYTEINSWIVRKKESKYGNYEYLYLTLNKKEIIKLNSFDYVNFEEIKSKIVKKKPQNNILKEKLDKKEKIKFSIILILLGVLFIYAASQFYKDNSLTKNDVYIIKGTLSEDIELKRSKKSRSLVFKLENLSDFEFKIGSLALNETYYEDLMNDFKKGDEIYLTIEKDQYQKKINKKVQMSFLDKYFHYEKIDVVEVKNKSFKYLSLSDFNKTNRKNDYWGIGFFGIFGLLLTTAGIYIYPKNKKVPLLKATHS
jgi:hypothetical protein